jgi:Arc-like DNA binding dprotein
MAPEKATDKLQVKVRMPRELADELSAAAERSGVSLSTEIVNRLQLSLANKDIRILQLAGQRTEALKYLGYITAAATGAHFEVDKKGDKPKPKIVTFAQEGAKKK